MIYPTSIRQLLPAFLLVATFGNPIQAQQEALIPAMAYENVSYGDHPNHVIDFWKAGIDGPAPLVVFIHGGGFTGGSHDKVAGKKIQLPFDNEVSFLIHHLKK